METKKVNTTKSLKEPVVTDAELNREMAVLERTFMNEEMVEVTLPEMIGKVIGNPYYGSFNGVPYTLVAGVPRKLPKSIAQHVQNVIIHAK